MQLVLQRKHKNTCLITAGSPRAGMRALALPEYSKEPTNISSPDYPPFHPHHNYSTVCTVSFLSIYAKPLMKLGAMDN